MENIILVSDANNTEINSDNIFSQEKYMSLIRDVYRNEYKLIIDSKCNRFGEIQNLLNTLGLEYNTI